jgi:hypothetical protein
MFYVCATRFNVTEVFLFYVELNKALVLAIAHCQFAIVHMLQIDDKFINHRVLIISAERTVWCNQLIRWCFNLFDIDYLINNSCRAERFSFTNDT